MFDLVSEWSFHRKPSNLRPSYIPWLGLLSKIDDADLFCVFDGVPMESSGFENRQRIRTATGVQWLTVPVHHAREVPIKDIEIAAGHNWQRKHWRAIELAYHKAKHFDRYGPEVRAVITQPWQKLAELDLAMLHYFLGAFGITTRTIRASDNGFNGVKSDLVLDMCRKLGVTEYVFGQLVRGYADLQSFMDAGIGVEFQYYTHPEYPQLHGAFQPYMGALDLLFNVGGEKGIEVIRSGR